LLARLTTLAQELAGAFRPATVTELVALALAELLKPTGSRSYYLTPSRAGWR